MRVGEAIALLNELKPNALPESHKLRWLSELDGIAAEEIFSLYGGAPDFSGYGAETAASAELLIPPPYDEAYVNYLFAQVDFLNGDFARYNNAMALFNAAYAAFADHMARTHSPAGRKVTLP